MDGDSMTKNKKNYTVESLWEVEHFLVRKNIDKDLLNEAMILV